MQNTESNPVPLRGRLAPGAVVAPGDVGREAAAAAARGEGSIWFADGAAHGHGCAFVLAVWAAAATDALQVGVWTEPGVDHPLRFAEEFAVLDRLSGGRALVGLARCERRDWAWVRAVAAAWTSDDLVVAEPQRLPARDAANAWVPPGWKLRVSPRPVRSPVPWWFDPGTATLPTGVPGRACRIVTARGLQMLEEAA